MHNYLRAIGFSKLKNKIEENTLITASLNDYSNRSEIEIGSDTTLTQITKSIGPGIGLCIVAVRT